MSGMFNPKNKAFYTGKAGRILLGHAGERCIVEGSTTYPAEHTRNRKPLDVTFIRFPGCTMHFQVRPKDVEPCT